MITTIRRRRMARMTYIDLVCPNQKCRQQGSKVVDSRAGFRGIRRRRECLHGARRYTTYENIVSATELDAKITPEQDIRVRRLVRQLVDLLSEEEATCSKL